MCPSVCAATASWQKGRILQQLVYTIILVKIRKDSIFTTEDEYKLVRGLSNGAISFKVTPLFDAEYLRNGTRYKHNFNGILIHGVIKKSSPQKLFIIFSRMVGIYK